VRRWGVVRKGDWTPAEIEQLRSLAGHKCSREIAEIMGRGKSAVCQKMLREGIEGLRSGRQCNWTERDFQALRDLKPGISSREFARQIGKSRESVRFWARKFGLRFKSKFRIWTEERIEDLIVLGATHTIPEAARELGLSQNAVRKACGHYGVTMLKHVVRKDEPITVRVHKPVVVKSAAKKVAPRETVSRLSYCQFCHAPVSDPIGHRERMGCGRRKVISVLSGRVA
jgi:hypothetical protein